MVVFSTSGSGTSQETILVESMAITTSTILWAIWVLMFTIDHNIFNQKMQLFLIILIGSIINISSKTFTIID
jgi:hypothetical protein